MKRVYPPAEYKRVAHTLREHMEAGLYKPGERLPTVARLAEMYGVRLGTAYEALRLLVLQGDAVSRRGLGYYVSEAGRAS